MRKSIKKEQALGYFLAPQSCVYGLGKGKYSELEIAMTESLWAWTLSNATAESETLLLPSLLAINARFYTFGLELYLH